VQHTTVARRLSALEAELGVPLFYRTNTGYTLTTYGQKAVAPAEAMELAALALAARTREAGGATAGHVRVAMAPEFASHWFVPRLDSFRRRYPQIDVHVLVGTRERDLTRGEAELSVQSPRPRPRNLVTVRLARTATRLYASRRLCPREKWRITSVDTLLGVPLLTFTPSFSMLQDAKWFQPLLAEAPVAMQTNSTHALLAAAQAHVGVAVLPRFVGRWYGDLIEVSDDVGNLDVWLIAHPEFRRDPRVRAVAEFLKRIATGPDGIS
jgi:DNA-binding transcriptional LysR family regulator